MKKYILALDEGTTSARAILFDRECNILNMAQHEVAQIFPQPGYVEQDAMDVFANQFSAMTECVAKSGINVDEIAAIGITNQRETTIIWDKNTGKPIYNAIVWQCRRTTKICEELEKTELSKYIPDATGLRIDAYFSATKIKWILDNVEGAREKADNGDLLFGTVDTWLVWKLTDGLIHVTDRTNASRTMLYNIHEDKWDKKILSALDIPESMLPEIKSSSEVYGYVDMMGTRVPISGIAGDQQAALFGQCCFEPGNIKTTYGTGCFLLANTGNVIVNSKNGLLTTIAATENGIPVEYALEGSVFVGGAVIQWLRDELGLISESKDSEYFASKVKDNGGVYLVPAFTGLGAPYWDMRARGIIYGLTRGSNRNHIIRASLESIVYQTDDVIKAMEYDFGKKIDILKADGGASVNKLLMQFQSDISNLEVSVGNNEATALGAAFLAGLSVGFFTDRHELKKKIKSNYVYNPSISEIERNKYIVGWKNAVNACRNQ